MGVFFCNMAVSSEMKIKGKVLFKTKINRIETLLLNLLIFWKNALHLIFRKTIVLCLFFEETDKI